MTAVNRAALLAATALIAATSAPADQYFGELKMSALRIRYEIVQVRDRYETHKLLPEEAEHLLVLTEDAFDDWTRRYPGDQWIASTGYGMAKVYQELPGTDAQRRAVALFVFVKTRFPSTKYAELSRSALHHGIPVRTDPPWAVTERALRAQSPSPSPLPSPSASPSAAPSPSPTGVPTPSATKSPLANSGQAAPQSVSRETFWGTT